MKKNSAVLIAQSNALTQARYDFTKVEKRALYIIISEVRRQFVETESGQRTLFDDMIINIPTKALLKSDTQLRETYIALRALRRKDIVFEDEKSVVCVGYIDYFEHVKHTESLQVQVSKKLLPHLVQLAEQFTTYSITVALSLKNKYSQRFYEYCSQFKKTGFMVINIDDLRDKLAIDEKYPRWALLKKNVIDPAQVELQKLFEKNECDLYFTYTEIKSGRTVERIEVKIITVQRADEDVSKLKPEDYLFHIKKNLDIWLYTSRRPKNKEYVKKVVKFLQLNPQHIESMYNRFEKLIRDEPTSNHAALARHIIEEDYLQ